MKLFISLVVLSVCTALSVQSCKAALVSEYQPNPSGVDSLLQTGELSGMAGTSFSGYLLGIGGEVGRRGVVDNVAEISGTFDSNGLLVFEFPDFLQPTITIALVTDFNGTAGVTDIDTNDDGIADNLSALIGIQDAIGIPDIGVDENFLYGSDLGGQDFSFTGDEPMLIFRDASTGSWYAVNDPANGQVFGIDGQEVTSAGSFDGDPYSPSFGAINPSFTAVPEPSSVIALGAVAVLGLVRSRKRVFAKPAEELSRS